MAKDDQVITSLGLEAGGVAHDFDNALTAIVSHAALIRAQSREPEAIGHAEAILRATRVASQVVERVRRLLRPGTPTERVRVELGQVLEEALVVCEIRARDRGVSLQFRRSQAPVVAVVDLAEVQQALSNLVNNAVEAARTEVRVEAAAACGGEAEVRVLIEDDGPGIPPAERARALEPLFTTRPGGTGLGLPQAHRVITSHGGRLSLGEARLGGLRVEVSLPALSTATRTSAPPRPITDFELDSSVSGQRILVIDDEVETRDALTILLSAAGFVAEGAASAPEALRAYQRQRPDLVVTDLQLGDSFAGQLITQMSVLDPTVPIIVVSGLLDSERPRSLRGRVSASFEKPISPGRLLDTVRHLLTERLALTRHHRTPR